MQPTATIDQSTEIQNMCSPHNPIQEESDNQLSIETIMHQMIDDLNLVIMQSNIDDLTKAKIIQQVFKLQSQEMANDKNKKYTIKSLKQIIQGMGRESSPLRRSIYGDLPSTFKTLVGIGGGLDQFHSSECLKYHSISDIYEIMHHRNELSEELRMFGLLLHSELLNILIEDDTINDLDKSKAVALKLSNIQTSCYGDNIQHNVLINIIQRYGSIHSPIRIAIKKGLAHTVDVLIKTGGGTSQFWGSVCTGHHHAIDITKLIHESGWSDGISKSLQALEVDTLMAFHKLATRPIYVPGPIIRKY